MKLYPVSASMRRWHGRCESSPHQVLQRREMAMHYLQVPHYPSVSKAGKCADHRRHDYSQPCPELCNCNGWLVVQVVSEKRFLYSLVTINFALAPKQFTGGLPICVVNMCMSVGTVKVQYWPSPSVQLQTLNFRLRHLGFRSWCIIKYQQHNDYGACSLRHLVRGCQCGTG